MTMNIRPDKASESAAPSNQEKIGSRSTRYSNQQSMGVVWGYQQRTDFAAMLEGKPEDSPGRPAMTEREYRVYASHSEMEDNGSASRSEKGSSTIKPNEATTKHDLQYLEGDPEVRGEEYEEKAAELLKNRQSDNEYPMLKEELSITTVQALINEQSQYYNFEPNTAVSPDNIVVDEGPVGQRLDQMIQNQVERLLINARQSSWDPTEVVRLQLKEQFLPGTTLSLQQSSPGCWRLMANCRQAEIRDLLQKTLPALQSRFRDKKLGELDIMDVVLDSGQGDELW